MKKYAVLLLSLLFFVKLCFSLNEADSVIIAVQKERLTKEELIEFNSLKNSMYALDEVNYFRKIYRHIDDLKKFYHLSCTANEDSIFNVLNRKTFFDTVFYDHPSKPCCDNPVYATDPLDTTYIQNLIDLPCAWDITTGDTTIKIGIIDRDFYQNLHEDIINKVNNVYGPYYGDKRDYFLPPGPGDTIWPHGLFMAGIISAEVGNNKGISGISNKLSFNGYRLSDTGDSYLHISEIHNAIENGTFEQQEKILNISYHDICLSDYAFETESYDSLFYQSIVDNGTLIVTAAGNERNPSENNKHQIYDIPGVIVVGAVNHENKIYLDDPQFQCNPYIGICAPGIGITTTHWEDGASSYVNGNGTSNSTAIVSGVAGLILSVDSTLTPPEIEHILKTSADSIADFDEANTWVVQNYYNGSFNAGSLNAYHAVYKAKHFNECTPSYIQTGQNITWNDTTYCCDSLIVEGTLTITAPVHLLTNLPQITIQNGGHLVFDTGSEIYHWADENYAGNINVEAGSTLEFKNGSDIVLAENGKIMVNHDTNNSGDLVFNNGATLTLQDDNTNLEIEGDLHIASNTTFSFSGSGYIKFSNPGGDATNNIFCGTNASFVLQGSGQNDKIMEVQQSTVHFPAGIDKVELRDGKIEMGSNCRLQNDITTGDEETILNNIKITSDNGSYNGHRGFGFWGQQYVTIEDCTFEYGKYGLNANNTYT